MNGRRLAGGGRLKGLPRWSTDGGEKKEGWED